MASSIDQTSLATENFAVALPTEIPDGKRLEKIREFIKKHSAEEVQKELFNVFPEKVNGTVFFDFKNNGSKFYNMQFVSLKMCESYVTESDPRSIGLSIKDSLTKLHYRPQDIEDIFLLSENESSFKKILKLLADIKYVILCDRSYYRDTHYFVGLEIVNEDFNFKFFSFKDVFKEKEKIIFAVKKSAQKPLMGY